jgi:hypothetical protein
VSLGFGRQSSQLGRVPVVHTAQQGNAREEFTVQHGRYVTCIEHVGQRISTGIGTVIGQLSAGGSTWGLLMKDFYIKNKEILTFIFEK